MLSKLWAKERRKAPAFVFYGLALIIDGALTTPTKHLQSVTDGGTKSLFVAKRYIWICIGAGKCTVVELEGANNLIRTLW